jgi:hypothetical protein
MSVNESVISGDYLSVDMEAPNLSQRIPRVMERHYREAVGPGSCLYEMANPRSTGKSDDVTRVPSILKFAKDGSTHEWVVRTDFKLKKEFAAMMDSNPECYAWGLNDLKKVKEVEYSIELIDPKPVFVRQYHLARREHEFAETWVKELEEAGTVREVESPFAEPIVVVPKKDVGDQWTHLRFGIDNKRLNVVTMRDQYPTQVPEEILAKMDGATLFASTDS